MGDISAEPSMEDILSSIKRIIAEEGEPPRARRGIGSARAPEVERGSAGAAVLELNDPIGDLDDAPAPKPAAIAARHDATPEPPVASAPKPAAGPANVSAATVEATRGAFGSLSRLVVKPDQAGADTLEGLVRDMLRPMLAQWLDANLPTLVEQLVAREIARITAAEL